MTKRLETFGGNHLRDVVAEALALAVQSGESVDFEFNGSIYLVHPDDSSETATARAAAVLGQPLLTASEDSARAKADLDRIHRESADAIAAAAVPTEQQLRDVDVPWLTTAAELSTYIAALVDRPHDYGTCVYAMSLAAVAAFQYVAGALGVTGFQASCADLNILKRTRHLTGPFMIVDGDDMLYPQSDLREKLDAFLSKNRPWAAGEAAKKIAEASEFTHPAVRAHWDALVREDAGSTPIGDARAPDRITETGEIA